MSVGKAISRFKAQGGPAKDPAAMKRKAAAKAKAKKPSGSTRPMPGGKGPQPKPVKGSLAKQRYKTNWTPGGRVKDTKSAKRKATAIAAAKTQAQRAKKRSESAKIQAQRKANRAQRAKKRGAAKS